MNLKQKLIEIRKQVAFLQKDTKAYNYKYVSEDKVLFAIKDTMDELGVLLVPSVENHSSKEFEYIDKQQRTIKENVVSGDMIFTWMDADSDETLIVPFALYGQQGDASQAFGSALTYCNRYFLLKFFQVATNENDPDKLVSKKKEKEDTAYAQSLARIKKNIPDKVLIECNNDKELSRTVIDEVLEKFGYSKGNDGWKAYNVAEVSEKAFMAAVVQIKNEKVK